MRTHNQLLSVNDLAYVNGLSPRPDAIIPRIGISLSGFGQALIRSFETANIYTPTPSYSLHISRDKFFAGQVLNARGIDMPKTVTLTNPVMIDDAIAAIGGYPFIAKELRGTQGQAVHLIADKDAAHEILKSYIRHHSPFLIQEYIAESEGSDLRCFVIGGKVVGAMKRSAMAGDFRANIHAGGTAIKIDLNAAEREMAIKSAEYLGLDIAGVDILQSRTGPKLLEVNSSPGLEGIEKATGEDIAGEIIRYIAIMALKKKTHKTKKQKTKNG